MGVKRMDRNAEDTIRDEDQLSSVALKKAVIFFLYSLVGLVAVETFLVVTNLFDLPYRDRLRLGLWVPLEAGLLFLVLLGVLPGSRGAGVRGFTDRQFAMAITGLSLIPLVLGFSVLSTAIFNWIVNGVLVVGVVLFFVIKSAVTGRVRLTVLSGLALPLAQLWFGGGAPPPGG
jgi:hypothetical protein